MTTTDRDKLRTAAEATVEFFGPSAWPDIASVALIALLDQIDQTETERDEWRQTAKDEHAAALDLIEVVKVRDRRVEAVRNVLDAPPTMTINGQVEYPDGAALIHAIRHALDGDS